MRYKYNPRLTKYSAGNLSKIDKSFYRLFHGIRSRCCYPSDKDYCRYGGRGIKMNWKNYVDFKKDMYESYIAHKKKNSTTTIERINVNGPYSKENCKWATRKEQYQNRRTSRYITYKGRTMIVADWAKELGMSRQTLRNRLEVGWTIKQIIETPVSYANRL